MTNLFTEEFNEKNKGRFVIEIDGIFAGEMTFSRFGPQKIIIDHTGVEEDFEGQGLAKQLFFFAVEYLKQNDTKALPLCPFAKKMFDRHPELSDLVYSR